MLLAQQQGGHEQSLEAGFLRQPEISLRSWVGGGAVRGQERVQQTQRQFPVGAEQQGQQGEQRIAVHGLLLLLLLLLFVLVILGVLHRVLLLHHQLWGLLVGWEMLREVLLGGRTLSLLPAHPHPPEGQGGQDGGVQERGQPPGGGQQL